MEVDLEDSGEECSVVWWVSRGQVESGSCIVGRGVRLWFKPGGSPDGWSKRAIQGEKGRDDAMDISSSSKPIVVGALAAPVCLQDGNRKLDNYLSGPSDLLGVRLCWEERGTAVD